MKRFLSLLLAAMMLLSLVACGGGTTSTPGSGEQSGTLPPPAVTPPSQGMAGEGTKPADPAPSTPADPTPSAPAEVKYKDRIVIAHTTAIDKHDPHADGTATGYMAYKAVLGNLLDYFPETGEYRPDLAESWEVNGKVYTFHLRKGVTFHNGETFKASDVVFSINRMKEGTATKAYVTDVVDVRAIDDYTVEIELSAPNAEFLVKLGLGNACIVNEKAVTDDPEKGTMIGTGAYVWTEQVPQNYNLFTRNENYWGELPPSKEIEFRFYAERAACSIALQTGEVDVQLEIAAADAHHIAEDKNTTLIQKPTFKMVYLALNTNGVYPEYANQKVRQALNCATNREDIILAFREGYAFAPNGMIPIGVWGYDENVKAFNYDPEKAIALLAEEGYNASNPLKVQICATSTFAPLFEILQAQWAAVGVELTLQTSDSTTYSDLRNSKPDATHWAGIHQYNFTGTDSPLRTIWHSTGSSNHSKTFKPELDAMLDAAVQEMDPDKRLEKYAELSQWLADWCGWVPLYQDILLIGQRANVTGMYYGPATDHDFTYAGVVLEG